MIKEERKALRKELGRKKMQKRLAKLSRYAATKELVTFSTDEMSVSDMASYVKFAAELSRTRPGLHFSGNVLRVDKTYSEMVDTVLDAEDRKRRYGY